MRFYPSTFPFLKPSLPSSDSVAPLFHPEGSDSLSVLDIPSKSSTEHPSEEDTTAENERKLPPSDSRSNSPPPHSPEAETPPQPAPSSKGYAYVPYYNKAPRDISSSIDTSNFIEGS